LLNIPWANFFLSALFTPGAIVLNILLRSANWDLIPALLGANVVFYSGLTLVVILLLFRSIHAAKQELGLQEALPVNMGLQDARSVLKAKGIQFFESIENSENIVFKGPDRQITAAAGDRVLFSRLQTSASRFPCGHDMEIILLFGQNEKLKERYVQRLPICP
jgi:hypothetical protein